MLLGDGRAANPQLNEYKDMNNLLFHGVNLCSR